MTDIRQSPPFADFMKNLGWKSKKIGGQIAYLRKFPFAGYFAKMPRPSRIPEILEINSFRKKNRVFQFKIAPNLPTSDSSYAKVKLRLLDSGYKIDSIPFNPVTDIRFNLTKSEDEIFHAFSEAKRRGVRRAINNGITVRESDDIGNFIKIRWKQYGLFGFLVTAEMKPLWKAFYPKNGTLLLAYQEHRPESDQSIIINNPTKPLAGIFMLYYNHRAYYWYASALRIGKKLFAPTLLVWEAIKLAKKKGCKQFYFEGICDDRFPKASESWKGFTKFKEGFGGEKIIYSENFST